MEGEGMVAVVRGLKDAGLAVTVVDGERRYTLIPNAEPRHQVGTGMSDAVNYHCNSSAQAVDGRYTSTYQAAHCNMNPTSPMVHVHEFPPQRPKGYCRHGNFEVGGAGSGEAYIPVKKSPIGRYPIAPEKGRACSPHNSSATYTFASSLRKYPPNLSPDRSTEMVERLINYSPVKHLSRTHQRTSPVRVVDDSCTRDPILKNPSKSGRESPGEPDFSTRVRKVEKSTKEKRMESAGIPHGDYRIPQEYDIRFLKDLPPRRVPNRFRAAADRMSDFYASPTNKNEHKHYNLPNTFINSVDTESQAAVKMVSREVSTAATPAPSRRTIAVPLTPSPSTAKAEGECSCVKSSYSILYKYSETALRPLNRLNSRKSVQTVCSSIEFKYNRSTIGDNRRSRSHDDLRITEDDFRWDALDLLEGLSHGTKTKHTVGVCGKLIDTWLDPDKNEVKSSISEEISFEYIDYSKNCEEIVNKSNKRNKRVNCVESTSVNAEQELECIIKIWLNEISIQTKDFQGKHLDKNAVLYSTANKIKTLVLNKYIADSELKSKIMIEMQGIPVSSHWNIELHVDKLINIILHQEHNVNTQMAAKKTNKISHCLFRHKNNKKAILTESDFKNFVDEMLIDFMNKSNKEISEHRKCCVEEELVDVLINSIDSIRHGIDSHVRAHVQNTLIKLGQITNQQAYVMTKKLFNNFHDILHDDNFSNSYTVLPVPSNRNNEVINTSKDNDSILPIDEKDVRANLDTYTRHLGEVIDAWLASLNLRQIDERLRQVVVNDLAGEIIDRQNYLELKPSSRGTDNDELEQLKFQIFKWLNKLVGDDVTKAISHAQELMDKIGSLPVPMSANLQENIVESDNTPFINEQPDYQPSLDHENCIIDEPERQLSTSHNDRHFSNLTNLPPCCAGKNRLSIVETQKNIDEEYDKFVQQWLLEIPIPVTNLEEQKAADLARLSIYSSIWKAITRLKFDPKIYSNSYYYQDILEDEIEELLQKNLPQTKELEHIKDKLKAQLIEKTLTMNEQIKAAAAPSCFKQQLLDNLDNYLPKNVELTEDEVIAKNDLVEDYILFTTYKENNDVTGNIHRSSFLRNVEKLADSMKKNHKDEFKQMNYQIYVNELISAVSKVPMPDNDAVKQEACEILVQKEVDHWLTDLPLKSDFNPIEKLNMRNTMASKVNEIGKEMNLSDCNAKKELRKVLPKYLKKLPLNEDANLNFLISELINRLKCMPKQVKRKSVSFQIPQNYEEFSRYMPGCSSLLGHSRIPDEGSYMIVGGEVGPEPKNFLSFKQPTVPESEWLSMEQTKPPSGMINWSQRSPRNSEYENTESEKLPVSYDQPLPYQEPYFTHYPRNPSFIMPSQNTAPGVTMQVTQKPLTPLATQNSNAETQSTRKLHPMARGGMGVLGTSQTAEPSGVKTSNNHAYVQPSKTINNYKVPETFTSSIAEDGKAIADSQTNTAADQPQQHEFYLSTDSKGYQIDHLLCRTVHHHRHSEARLTNSAKKSKSSFISNHFTPSSIIVVNKQEENIPIKSKSDEEVIEKLKVKESENIIGYNKEEHLQQAETVIVNMVVDKTKSHLEKLQNLASKLNDPVEENRLKKKINYFLHKSLNIFDNINMEATELKRQLPDRIINRLKTVLLINAHKGKNPKYYSRCIMEKLKATVKDWLNKLNVKKKDEFGTTIDDDILNYVIDKIQPIVLNRPKSDSEYKRILELKAIDIVNSLSLFSGNQNSNLVGTLVNEIINIDGKIPITYIQPTNAEIRQFVKDEIIFISEQSHVEISNSKMQNLEIILSDLLLDITDVKDLNDYVIYEIAKLFEDIAELPADQAKFYTNIIINDYKEFYFRLHFFSGRKNKIFIPDNTSSLPTKNNSASSNERSLERYINELINEIEKWFTKLNIQLKEKNFQEIVTKNLACDIVDRYKYLETNPNSKGTVLEELEHLKYQIFKRTSKIIGENALEHAEELMKSIHLLIVPVTFNVTNPINESSSKRSSEIHDPFIEFLSDLIYEWFHQLPLEAHSLEDTSFNRRLIKSLAEDIKETVDNSELYNIDKNVDEWIVKMFNRKLSSNYIQQLKNKIFPYVEESVKIMKVDLEQENVVKNYKVIIDKWVDNISLKDEVYVKNKSELVNKLAIKLYASVNRLSEPLSLNGCNLLREDILDWLKILPLDEHLSDKCMNKYADMLIANIKNYHLDTNPIKFRQTDDSLLLGRLEAAMLDCITKLPDNISEDKDIQESGKCNDFVLHHPTHDESLEASVEVWLNKLPIRVTDFVYFRIKKKTFIENLKLLRTLGANDKIIINEIIKFMKTLPMEIKRRQGNKDLQEKGLTLLKDHFHAKPCDDTAKSVENVIKNWAKPLSMKSTYDPKALISLIDKVSLLICDLINHPRLDLDEKHNKVIREEIISFLEKFAFKGFSEQIVSQMADCLTKNLKDIMKRKTQADVIVNDNSEIKTINKHTIIANLDAYAAEIAKQVNNWLKKFNFIQKDNKGFNTLIDNLVEDIIEREKYLKRSPQCQRRPKWETEQLRCLIYERVNKLLDCQKLDTTSYIDDLIKHVQSITVGMFTKNPQVYMQSQSVNLKKNSTSTPDQFQENGASNYSSSESPVVIDRSQSVTALNKNPKETIFEKYENIFKKKVYDLPIETPTPESIQLSELARTGIYNGIMKTFFSLKSDQELENDYGYFELILEDKLDDMLDLLPQTEEMQKMRHGWKVSILSNAMDMLKEMQEVSDRPSFKQRLKDGFNRKFAKNFELEQCFLLQQGFLAEMAEAYILETKYKEDDPLKANIYRQRLMKKVDEMANHLTRLHNIEFRFLQKPQLIQHAMKILAEVPLPNENILNEEVEEILLAEEIEQWYKELPVSPYINDFDQVFRKRMMNILAQKLHEIDKNNDELNESKEEQMKHEISKFLTERARLEHDKDLNINFMVDELNNRLKQRRLKDLTTYDAFEKKKPISSSFAKLDNTEILAPLIDAYTDTDNIYRNQAYPPTDQYLQFRHGVIDPGQAAPNQTNKISKSGPQHHILGPRQLSDQKSPHYSNGIPYQWPAEQPPDIQTSETPRDNTNYEMARQNPRNMMHSGVPIQINRHPPSLSTSNFTRSNLGSNIQPEQGRPKQTSFQETDSYANELNSNQYQRRTLQRTYARGSKSLSPNYMPEQRQATNKPRPDSPEIRAKRNGASPNKVKPKLVSECVCSKQPKPRKICPLSPLVSNAQKSGRNRKLTIDNTLPFDNNLEQFQGACMRPVRTKCSPDCIRREMPCERFYQGSRGRITSLEQEEIVEDKSKTIVKCKCNKPRRLCLDSRPCNCRLYTPCYD